MARKQDKLRPYRVDYFNIDEMKDNDMALVRSEIVRAVTSAAAASHVVDYNEALPLVLIRSYRFYKNLPKQSTVYKAVEDLFSEKNALIVMEEVEKYRVSQAQTNDLGNTPAAQTQMDAVATQADTAVSSKVFDILKQILVEQLGVDEDDVTPTTLFVGDLGADSLDEIELVMAAEEVFNIEIADEDAENIQTVGQAVDFISKKVGASVFVPDHATPDPAAGVDKATFYKNNTGTQMLQADDLNGHVTRMSDSSLYDEVCVHCGATDTSGKLEDPCPGTPATTGPTSPATVAVVDDLAGMLSHDAHEQVMDNFVPDSVPAGKTFPANTDMASEVTPFGEKCPECEDAGAPATNVNPFVVRDESAAPTWQKVLLFAGMLGTIMFLLWLILPHK